jgi:hypothetical protein
MQSIYKKQAQVTPEEEHVMSFLRGNNDTKVIEELERRKLTEEEKEELEGDITKTEMKEQLFNHMRPSAAQCRARIARESLSRTF